MVQSILLDELCRNLLIHISRQSTFYCPRPHLLFAQHVQGMHIGRFHDRPQPEDERGSKASEHAAANHPGIEREGDSYSDILYQATHKEAYAQRGSRANYASDQSKQPSFQAKEEEEIFAVISDCFEQRDLVFAPRELDLHRIENADATDEERNQAGDCEEGRDPR